MIVQVRLFAAARQAAAEPAVAVSVPAAATIADLRRALVEQFPALGAWEPHLLFAVDQQFVQQDQPVPEQGEIACFPPVSGG